MTDSDEVKLLPREEVLANATRAICARNSGGYCEFIGHDGLGCMVGWGEAPEAANCKMTDAALCLTAEYEMARAALATRPPVVTDEVVERVLAKAEAQIDENERAMIEERKGQYGSAFKQEQLVAIQGLHKQQRNGVKLARAALASMPAVVSGGQGE